MISLLLTREGFFPTARFSLRIHGTQEYLSVSSMSSILILILPSQCSLMKNEHFSYMEMIKHLRCVAEIVLGNIRQYMNRTKESSPSLNEDFQNRNQSTRVERLNAS